MRKKSPKAGAIRNAKIGRSARSKNGVEPDIEHIRSELVRLINAVLRERLSAGRKLRVSRLLPLPNGEIVEATRATPAQWQAAIKWFLEGALDEIAPKLHAVIQMSVSHSYYLSQAE